MKKKIVLAVCVAMLIPSVIISDYKTELNTEDTESYSFEVSSSKESAYKKMYEKSKVVDDIDNYSFELAKSSESAYKKADEKAKAQEKA